MLLSFLFFFFSSFPSNLHHNAQFRFRSRTFPSCLGKALPETYLAHACLRDDAGGDDVVVVEDVLEEGQVAAQLDDGHDAADAVARTDQDRM